MFSQYDEEKYILAAFALSPTLIVQRFLDIGAFHAKDKSNTRALFEISPARWEGVMIEPSPGPMRGLVEAYGKEDRITLVSAAVGLEAGLMELMVTDDAVSTSVESEQRRWKDAGGYFGKLTVPVLTLEDISLRFGGFDFVNLDAEGISADLFLKVMELGWEPGCICVEHDGRTTELLQSATQRGYHCTYMNGTNLVVVR